MKMLSNLEEKLKLYIFCPTPPVQKINVPAPLTVSIIVALHCYAFAPVFYFLCLSAVYSRYATAGCEGKDKKFMLLNSAPPSELFR